MRRRKRGNLHRVIYIGLPFALLAVDIALFPLFESAAAARPLNAVSLVREGRQRVGRIRLHEIEATLDTLEHPAFGAEVGDELSAIVVPCFVERDDPEATMGLLGRYVQDHLNAISPGDSARLSAILKSGRLDKGTVNDLPLHIPPKNRAAFPFDHVLIVTLAENSKHGSGDENVFSSAVPRLMQMAAADRIVTLVVPAVGYNWENENSISFDSLYEPLLGGLESGSTPKTIVLDLYRDWPTFSIEHAVGAINAAMEHFLLANPTTRIYRQDVRILLPLVASCLFFTARYVPLTLKNFAIITTAYVGLCLGSSKFVDVIAVGWTGIGRTITQILIFAALSYLFPVIIPWKAEQIFPPERHS